MPRLDKRTGPIRDRIIIVTGRRSAADHPDKLRRIKVRDAETGNTLVFPTNNLAPPAPTIARLYKCRRRVELFVKWTEQHPRIKRFFGASENAVKTRVRIAVSVDPPVAIAEKRLHLDAGLDTISPVLGVTAFEKTSLLQLLSEAEREEERHPAHNRLNLFNY